MAEPARQAFEVVLRYRAKGLTGRPLRKAVERHARLLRALDPAVATELEQADLRTGESWRA